MVKHVQERAIRSSHFRLVEWDETANHADTISREKAASNKEWDSSRRSLEDDTEGENQRRDHQTPSTTEKVSGGRSGQGTTKGTGREQGHDQG